jgi:protein-S-isoprenylcysteine O-methyltransferase Ste14
MMFGMLLMFAPAHGYEGPLLGVAGFPCCCSEFGLARLEEQWLVQELDRGAYADYRKRVPMLIPFGPKK